MELKMWKLEKMIWKFAIKLKAAENETYVTQRTNLTLLWEFPTNKGLYFHYNLPAL